MTNLHKAISNMHKMVAEGDDAKADFHTARYKACLAHAEGVDDDHPDKGHFRIEAHDHKAMIVHHKAAAAAHRAKAAECDAGGGGAEPMKAVDIDFGKLFGDGEADMTTGSLVAISEREFARDVEKVPLELRKMLG
jgi:hypothetical protein